MIKMPKPGKIAWGVKSETMTRRNGRKTLIAGRTPVGEIKKTRLRTRAWRRFMNWLHGGTPVNNRNLPPVKWEKLRLRHDLNAAEDDAVNRARTATEAKNGKIVKKGP